MKYVSHRWRLWKTFVLGLLAVTLIAGIALGLWSRVADPLTIARRLETYSLSMQIWRLLLIGVLWMVWEPWLIRRGQALGLSAVGIDALRQSRWPLAGLLLAVELLLVQRWPAQWFG